MAGCWELKRQMAITKKVDIKFSARSSSSFGTVYEYEQTRPERQETFSGRGFEWDETGGPEDMAEAVLAPIDQPENIVELTDAQGTRWSGSVRSVTTEPSDEGTNLWNMTIVMFNPTKVV